MNKIDIIKNSKPPKILYHYTTADGLLGILNSKSIWATHVSYVNDRQEFVYLLDILRAVMRDEEYPELVKFYEIVEAVHNDLIKANFTVTSFSEAPDLLSQWRAYSSSSLGYCIGFNTESMMQRQKFYQCVYDTKLQRDLVTALMRIWQRIL